MMKKEKVVLMLKQSSLNETKELKKSYEHLLKQDGRYEIVFTVCSPEIKKDYLVKLSDYIDSKFKEKTAE